MISVQEPAKIDIKTTIMLLFSSLNSSTKHLFLYKKICYIFTWSPFRPFYMWIYGYVYDLFRIEGEGQSSPISRIESVHDT